MTHDYDPNWDYEVDDKPPREVVVAVEQARVGLKRAALALDLGVVTIYYVKGLEKQHLARYISGTGSEPVFVLDAQKLVKGAKRHGLSLEAAVVPTLKHELGHAYLETLGVESEEGVEEIVERFAHTCWDQGDEVGVEWLRSVGEKEVLKLG